MKENCERELSGDFSGTTGTEGAEAASVAGSELGVVGDGTSPLSPRGK